MLVLVGSFSYTSRVSFSEDESHLHSPCCFQRAVLGTCHACMPDVSFTWETSDYWCRRVPCGKAEVLLHIDHRHWERIEVTGKERQRQGHTPNTAFRHLPPVLKEVCRKPLFGVCGKVCPVTARHPLHTQLHTRSGLLVWLWQAWANRRAAATHSPPLASSEYSLARLRADMTLSVHLP